MIPPATRSAGSNKISELSRIARSLKFRLTQRLLGKENEELVYWNDCNAHIEEAISMAGEDEVRITNFITDHDGFGLYAGKEKGRLVQDLHGVGDKGKQSRPVTTD